MIMPRLLKQHAVWQPSLFHFFFAASYFVLLYYLPIYFQSVDGASPIRSGVLNLPLVLALAFGSTVSGVVVSKTGHAAPFMLGGAILSTIATGLIYTFDIGTDLGKWVGYQFFYGIAIGLGFQMAINITQANAKLEDVSTVTAIVFFFQVIGGAFAIAAAQAGFVSRLVSTLATSAPNVVPADVIATGATQIRHSFPNDIIGVVFAYMAGIKVGLAIVVGLAGICCVIGIFAPWKKLNMTAMQGGVA